MINLCLLACQIDRRVASTWPPTVSQWLKRMGALGHGEVSPASWDRALQDIAENQPIVAGVVLEPYQVGERVGVTPSDYARDETAGELMGLNKDRIVMSRTLDSGHVIYLHFPREGFELRRLQ